MVHIRGTLVFLIDGYEFEIDHDGFTGGGVIYLRLAGQTGQKTNIPIRIDAAAKIGAAITQIGAIAGEIENTVERLSKNVSAQQRSIGQIGVMPQMPQ